MATSGTYRYNVTANDIITEALGLIGVYSVGESIDASESADALRTLNMMLKLWQGKNVGLWLSKEVNLFFANGQASYDVGPTGDHCAQNVVKTELATAMAIGQGPAFTLDSVTGFGDTFDRNGIITAVTPAGAGAITFDGALVTNGIATLSGNRPVLIYSTGNESARTFTVVGQDAAGTAITENITGPNGTTVYSTNSFQTVTSVTINGAGTGSIEVGQVGDPIGFEQNNDTLHWTYLAGPLSVTPAIVTGLTVAASIDNHVYSYTAKCPRPVEIIECRLHRADDTETPIGIYGRLDYELLSNKTQTGTPNQVYYDKQLNNGKLYVWLVPTDMQNYLKFTAKLPIQIIDNLTDNFEIAQEWSLPVAWNLAVLIYPKWHEGSFIDATTALMAQAMLEEAMISDSENAPITFRLRKS